MTIEFLCDSCGKELSTSDDKAGKTGRCPDCGEPVTVPQRRSSPASESPFDLESPASSYARSLPPASTQTCPMCGAETAAADSKCPQCGEELRPPEKPLGSERRFSTGHKIEVGLVLSTAWERFSAQMGMSIAGLIIGYFASAGLSYAMLFGFLIAVAVAQVSIALAILAGVFSYLALVVAQVWLGLGMCKFSLAIARGREPELTEIFTAGRFIGRGVLCSLLVAVIYLAAVFGMAVLAGFAGAAGGEVLGVVVMAIAVLVGIWLLMSFAWTGYVLVDTDAAGVSSVLLSRELMAGNYLSVLLLFIITQMIMLAGLLLCGVGLIFAFPLVMVIFAVTYDHLSGGREALDHDNV